MQLFSCKIYSFLRTLTFKNTYKRPFLLLFISINKVLFGWCLTYKCNNISFRILNLELFWCSINLPERTVLQKHNSHDMNLVCLHLQKLVYRQKTEQACITLNLQENLLQSLYPTKHNNNQTHFQIHIKLTRLSNCFSHTEAVVHRCSKSCFAKFFREREQFSTFFEKLVIFDLLQQFFCNLLSPKY